MASAETKLESGLICRKYCRNEGVCAIIISPSGEIPVGNHVDVKCNKYIRETRKSSEYDGDTTIVVVRQRSAKPSFTSSNLVVTSK